MRDVTAVLLRRAFAAAKAATGVPTRRLTAIRNRDAILMYHRVLRDGADTTSIDPGMYVRASTFDQHLELLLSRWVVGTLSNVLAEPSCDRPRVALTFDDGWRDNLEIAWPILRSHGVRATIFLVKSWCESGKNSHGLFMRPSEILDLARERMEFGAHTVSHPALDTLEPTRVHEEMLASREAVSEWTGSTCELFAYPYGRFNRVAEQVASELFQASVIVGGGWWWRNGERARIPRIAIHEDMTSTRALFVERLGQSLKIES